MQKVVVVSALLIGFMSFAQRSEHREDKRMGMQDMTSEQVATLQTKKLTLELDLTEDQQQEIQQLNLENAVLRREKMEERKKAKDEGETQKLSAEQRFDIQNKRLDHAIAHKQKMTQILSEVQFEKWEKMSAEKVRHHRGKMREKGKHGHHRN